MGGGTSPNIWSDNESYAPPGMIVSFVAITRCPVAPLPHVVKYQLNNFHVIFRDEFLISHIGKLLRRCRSLVFFEKMRTQQIILAKDPPQTSICKRTYVTVAKDRT